MNIRLCWLKCMADDDVSRVPVCHDVPRYQPMGQNGRPTGAVGGESEPSSRPALHRVQHECDWECGDCGLKQARSLRQCAFCKAESGGAKEDQNVIGKIRALNDVLKGMQQFLLDEMAIKFGHRGGEHFGCRGGCQEAGPCFAEAGIGEI